jgi:hypothetical protein
MTDYAFYYFDSYGALQPVQTPSVVSSADSVLPQGLASSSYVVDTLAEINDAYGASTNASAVVVVTPTRDEVSALQPMMEASLSEAFGEGDTDRVLAVSTCMRHSVVVSHLVVARSSECTRPC